MARTESAQADGAAASLPRRDPLTEVEAAQQLASQIVAYFEDHGGRVDGDSIVRHFQVWDTAFVIVF